MTKPPSPDHRYTDFYIIGEWYYLSNFKEVIQITKKNITLIGEYMIFYRTKNDLNGWFEIESNSDNSVRELSKLARIYHNVI